MSAFRFARLILHIFFAHYYWQRILLSITFIDFSLRLFIFGTIFYSFVEVFFVCAWEMDVRFIKKYKEDVDLKYEKKKLNIYSNSN